MPGTLYLLPTALDIQGWYAVPPQMLAICQTLNHFIVEDAKTARRALRSAGFSGSLEPLDMVLLNEHTAYQDVPKLLQPLKEGRDMGLMTDAGLPCVADPGHWAVQEAHKIGARVVPVSGPSSVMLALMASGLNGQSFVFHGYLPQEAQGLATRLRQLEQAARRQQQTQIWIETPYRNRKLLPAVLDTLAADTWLCIAADLTAPTEWIRAQHVAQWRLHQNIDLHKRPAVWLLGFI
jgi:16S rRNA (cytidine1402-2'-O)-methyltransferase